MAKYRISVNMEFVRSADLDFRAGVKVAATLGYKYVEPMVHTGWGTVERGRIFSLLFDGGRSSFDEGTL
jgi:hypothetical protein